jgi:hypothetical protein
LRTISMQRSRSPEKRDKLYTNVKQLAIQSVDKA